MSNIEDMIKTSVLNKEWTVVELTDIKKAVMVISEEVYSVLSISQKFSLLREYRVKEDYVGMYFDEVIKMVVTTVLKSKVATVINSLLSRAKVDFNLGGEIDEISERSLGGEPHKERSSDEKKDNENEE